MSVLDALGEQWHSGDAECDHATCEAQTHYEGWVPEDMTVWEAAALLLMEQVWELLPDGTTLCPDHREVKP